jgi:hypothetical protein
MLNTTNNQVVLSLTSNTAINCNVRIAAINSVNGTNSSNIQMAQMIVAQQVLVQNPGQIYVNYNASSNAVFKQQIIYNTIGTGSLSWSVTDISSNTISGLTITSTGELTYTRSDYYVDNLVSVTAKPNNITSNLFYSTCNIVFPLKISRTPYIFNPLTISQSMTTSNFTYTPIVGNSNTSKNETGPLKWKFTTSDALANPYLSINSNTGQITFQRFNSIKSTICHSCLC